MKVNINMKHPNFSTTKKKSVPSTKSVLDGVMIGQTIHSIKCHWALSLLDMVANQQNDSFDKVSFASCVNGLLSVYNMF